MLESLLDIVIEYHAYPVLRRSPVRNVDDLLFGLITARRADQRDHAIRRSCSRHVNVQTILEGLFDKILYGSKRGLGWRICRIMHVDSDDPVPHVRDDDVARGFNGSAVSTDADLENVVLPAGVIPSPLHIPGDDQRRMIGTDMRILLDRGTFR